MVTSVAAGLMAIYGLVALVGGVIGFLKVDSLASLLAGGGSGLVLLASAALTLRRPTLGLLVGGAVCLALLYRFAPGLIKAMNEGTQPLPMVPIIMTAGGIVVLLAVFIALVKSGVFKSGT